MSLLDRVEESFEVIRRNPLRTLLTAGSVAFGVALVIVLAGATTGLSRAAAWEFRDDAINSVWIWPGETAVPWEGLAPDRKIRFRDQDLDLLRDRVPWLDAWTGRYTSFGNTTVRYGDRTGSFGLRSVHPGHQVLEQTQVIAGRYLNDQDLADRRRVAVIGVEVERYFFRGRPAVGEVIQLAGLPFTVIGVYDDVGGEGEVRQMYLPITTAREIWGGEDRLEAILFTLSSPSAEAGEQAEAAARRILQAQHHFAPHDRTALRLRNNLERFEEVQRTFRLIGTFGWLVGLGTLGAAAVGVSNILLVSVQERTTEIGLRKALGARPADIVLTLVVEALVLCGAAGLAGLLAGLAILEAAAAWLPENDTLRDPAVDALTAFTTLAVVLLTAGAAAFVPARHAARITPVAALRLGG